ncbi:hypothetical protein [Longimicrobium sp.]|jgi:hypothetical protein|uniref:hypothetical protein n=1 Tax=Longimicrobium sp. TaxID=2029185 RepID=UPI002ED7CDA3
MTDKDIWGVKIGPVMVGGATDRKPKTKADRWWQLVGWIIVVALIASASPVLGVVLIFGTAIVVAAVTAPDPEKKNEDQP